MSASPPVARPTVVRRSSSVSLPVAARASTTTTAPMGLTTLASRLAPVAIAVYGSPQAAIRLPRLTTVRLGSPVKAEVLTEPASIAECPATVTWTARRATSARRRRCPAICARTHRTCHEDTDCGGFAAAGSFCADVDDDGTKECVGRARRPAPGVRQRRLRRIGPRVRDGRRRRPRPRAATTACAAATMTATRDSCASAFGRMDAGSASHAAGTCDQVTDCPLQQVCAAPRNGGSPSCQAGNLRRRCETPSPDPIHPFLARGHTACLPGGRPRLARRQLRSSSRTAGGVRQRRSHVQLRASTIPTQADLTIDELTEHRVRGRYQSDPAGAGERLLVDTDGDGVPDPADECPGPGWRLPCDGDASNDGIYQTLYFNQDQRCDRTGRPRRSGNDHEAPMPIS